MFCSICGIYQTSSRFLSLGRSMRWTGTSKTKSALYTVKYVIKLKWQWNRNNLLQIKTNRKGGKQKKKKRKIYKKQKYIISIRPLAYTNCQALSIMHGFCTFQHDSHEAIKGKKTSVAFCNHWLEKLVLSYATECMAIDTMQRPSKII